MERSYFESKSNDRQIEYFRDWKARGSLRNVLGSRERPLIEAIGSAEYEIVDGWGRLLPFAALLCQGMPFEPFEVYCAMSDLDLTHINA